ncbi:MAG: hypothetical protein DRN04_08760 [Thermoprotei archaeon]|nr:MAG: hypothetical protein DRN04_08760 [Thermoprotei archaeon]
MIKLPFRSREYSVFDYCKELKKQYAEVEKIHSKYFKGKLKPNGRADIEVVRIIRERLKEGRKLINELREEMFYTDITYT